MTAGGADIRAAPMLVVERTAERPFGPLSTEDPILGRRQPGAPLFVGSPQWKRVGPWRRIHVLGLSDPRDHRSKAAVVTAATRN
jgi:hypothetical protein